MKVLLIDDIRDIEMVMPNYRSYSDFTATTVRNFQMGIIALKMHGPFDILFLDHDLASFDENGKEKTGYDIMCFLEENPEYLPGEISIVSSNPVGRRNMQVVIDKLYGEK